MDDERYVAYRPTLRTSKLRAMDIATKNRWGFRYLGIGGMITSPIEREDWTYNPIDQDTSIIPDEAMKRVEALRQAGIQIKGLIVGHKPAEPPHKIRWQDLQVAPEPVIDPIPAIFFPEPEVLPVPVIVEPLPDWNPDEEPEPQVAPKPKRKIDWEKVEETAKQFGEGLLKVLGVILMVVGFIALIGFAVILRDCSGNDPSLVVVLEDDTWIEVMTWDA